MCARAEVCRGAPHARRCGQGGFWQKCQFLVRVRALSSRGALFCRGHGCFAPWDLRGHPCFGAAERRRAERALLPAQRDFFAEFGDMQGL